MYSRCISEDRTIAQATTYCLLSPSPLILPLGSHTAVLFGVRNVYAETIVIGQWQSMRGDSVVLNVVHHHGEKPVEIRLPSTPAPEKRKSNANKKKKLSKPRTNTTLFPHGQPSRSRLIAPPFVVLHLCKRDHLSFPAHRDTFFSFCPAT